MTIGELLRSLLPPVSYDPLGPIGGAEIDVHAGAIEAFLAVIDRIHAALSPSTAGQDIGEWEAMLALVPLPNANQASRVAAVLAKLGELGGLSIPYFIRLAASAGYTVSITEPRVFRAGVSRCGDRLYPEDVVFLWLVKILARPTGATSDTDDALQLTFDDLKPAHTTVQFVEA